ncbi:MAG: YdcH family protein [Pseudomonadota bacterium]
MGDDKDYSIPRMILELQSEHRELDQLVAELDESPGSNQLQIRRLKRRKLQIKDQITQLKSKLIPDLNA